MKTLTLMALSLMLRPSDIAPRSVKVKKGVVVQAQFTTDRLAFLSDGSAEVYLAGIKNDYQRDGFRVFLKPSSEAKMCPVRALKAYLGRTGGIEVVRPVFTPLQYPYAALSSATIAKILNQAISLAGLSGQGYTVKSFRPTGATSAVQNEVPADTARYIGRWKDRECFEKHYVHAHLPDFVTDAILLT